MPFDIWAWIAIVALTITAVSWVFRDERIHPSYRGGPTPHQRPTVRTVDLPYDWARSGL